MKKCVLTFVCLMICLMSYSQTTHTQGNPIGRSKVVVLSDSTIKKAVLYSVALQWFASTFKDAKSVIQMQDPESGIVMGKANVGVIIKSSVVYIDYTIKIMTKDGRIKYEIYDFYDKTYGIVKDGDIDVTPKIVAGMIKKQWETIKETCNNAAYNISESITETFQKAGKKPKDDW